MHTYLKKFSSRSISLKIALLISIFSISIPCFAQYTTIDARSKLPIPYVNIMVEGENKGTTSDENGIFALPKLDESTVLVFSTIGYESLKVQVNKLTKQVILTPKTIELSEIKIKPKKSENQLNIGKIVKKQINHYAGSSGHPWMIARFIPYEKEYDKTPFIKSFKILTNSDVQNSTFNVRLYGVQESGEPGEALYNSNIIVKCKKGKNITEIDLSDLNIQIPQKGFFVALEWLVIESNKHKFKYTIKGSKEKKEGISYDPKFGFSKENNLNSWSYNGGVWRQREKKSESPYSNPYPIALEMTLTD